MDSETENTSDQTTAPVTRRSKRRRITSPERYIVAMLLIVIALIGWNLATQFWPTSKPRLGQISKFKEWLAARGVPLTCSDRDPDGSATYEFETGEGATHGSITLKTMAQGEVYRIAIQIRHLPDPPFIRPLAAFLRPDAKEEVSIRKHGTTMLAFMQHFFPEFDMSVSSRINSQKIEDRLFFVSKHTSSDESDYVYIEIMQWNL